MNPRVEINLKKIRHNTETIVTMCRRMNIDVAGVTKVCSGNVDAARAMADGGVKYLADSRMENICNLQDINIPKMFLRIPMQSEIDYLVRYTDYSLNSEIATIKKISMEAVKRHKKHSIILMIDLGDLREGVWHEDFQETVRGIAALEGIEFAGIGTNLTCYGGVLPSKSNMTMLLNIAHEIRKRYGISLPIISGGNSSSLHLVDRGLMPEGINNLRIGEGIFLGRETAFGKKISGLYDDIFTLYGEIVEIKRKPSLPCGEIGVDAFGKTPEFVDRGSRMRAVIALGRQDINPEGIIPEDKDVYILGASSDHLIVDIEESLSKYEVGGEMSFRLTYGGLLQSMTSGYVKKVIVNENI